MGISAPEANPCRCSAARTTARLGRRAGTAALAWGSAAGWNEASFRVYYLFGGLLTAPLLAIEDERTDKRIDFVGGIRGTDELEKLVNEGKAAVAFSLNPTTIEDLLRVSDAGEIMPPKSTWFEPKLRDGLLIHEI